MQSQLSMNELWAAFEEIEKRKAEGKHVGGRIMGYAAKDGLLTPIPEEAKVVKRIFRDVHDREKRLELNLYVVGEEEESDTGEAQHADAAGSHLPEERSPNQ